HPTIASAAPNDKRTPWLRNTYDNGPMMTAGGTSSQRTYLREKDKDGHDYTDACHPEPPEPRSGVGRRRISKCADCAETEFQLGPRNLRSFTVLRWFRMTGRLRWSSKTQRGEHDDLPRRCFVFHRCDSCRARRANFADAQVDRRGHAVRRGAAQSRSGHENGNP